MTVDNTYFSLLAHLLAHDEVPAGQRAIRADILVELKTSLVPHVNS